MVYRGTVKNGVIVLDDATGIVEGQRVAIEPEMTRQTATQKLLELAGAIKGGPTDASVNHDHYLYGAPKRENP